MQISILLIFIFLNVCSSTNIFNIFWPIFLAKLKNAEKKTNIIIFFELSLTIKSLVSGLFFFFVQQPVTLGLLQSSFESLVQRPIDVIGTSEVFFARSEDTIQWEYGQERHLGFHQELCHSVRYEESWRFFRIIDWFGIDFAVEEWAE